MTVLTDAQLKTNSLIIKGETTPKANTASRVGSLFEDLSDSKVNISEIKHPSSNTIVESDFYAVGSTQIGSGLGGFAFTSGTILSVDAEKNHPGIAVLRSNAGGTNSGYGVLTLSNILIVGGGENFSISFKPTIADTSTVLRFGLGSIVNTNLPINAIFLQGQGNGTNIILEGICINNSIQTKTDTTISLDINTWYLGEFQVDDLGQSVIFKIFNDDGMLLWESIISSNIPEGQTRIGVLCFQTTSTITNIIMIDYFGFSNTRGLYRGKIDKPITPESFFGTTKFFDGFENGVATWENSGEYNSSFYGFGSSVISTEQSFSGTKSLKMVTEGKDVDFYAQTNNYQYGYAQNGDDIIINYKIYIPKNIGFYYPNGDYGFFDINQYKGVSNDNTVNSALYGVFINAKGVVNGGGENYISVTSFGGQWNDGLNIEHNQINGTGNEVEIPLNQWVDIKVRMYINDGSGILQIWQDDVMIFNLTNQKTFRNDKNIDRLDVTLSNYGRYHRSYVNGVWDGGNGVTIYADNFGLYNINTNYDYTQ